MAGALISALPHDGKLGVSQGEQVGLGCTKYWFDSPLHLGDGKGGDEFSRTASEVDAGEWVVGVCATFLSQIAMTTRYCTYYDCSSLN